MDRTPSHKTSSNTFILVHTSYCGSSFRTTCLHKTCSSTCHHMSERALSQITSKTKTDRAKAREPRWFVHRRCALKPQETKLRTKWSSRAPVLGRQSEFTEAVGAPGQVVPLRPAGLSVSPITRSETNLDMSVKESGPVKNSILSELMNAVRQVLMTMWFRRQKS